MELNEVYGNLVELRNLTAEYASNLGKMPMYRIMRKVNLEGQLRGHVGASPSLERIDSVCDFLYARLHN